MPAQLTANGEWVIRTGENTGDGAVTYITPSSANIIRDTNKKIEEFANRDANGFGMTIMAMCIVFTALLVLCLCFYGIRRHQQTDLETQQNACPGH